MLYISPIETSFPCMLHIVDYGLECLGNNHLGGSGDILTADILTANRRHAATHCNAD